MKFVNFTVYFNDELPKNYTEKDVDDVLALYGYKKHIKCPVCGKRVNIIDALFNPDYDIVRCADCVKKLDDQ